MLTINSRELKQLRQVLQIAESMNSVKEPAKRLFNDIDKYLQDLENDRSYWHFLKVGDCTLLYIDKWMLEWIRPFVKLERFTGEVERKINHLKEVKYVNLIA